MSFSESEIKEILRYYDIGSFIKFNGKLEDGFQSENLLILTDKGGMVILQVLYFNES